MKSDDTFFSRTKKNIVNTLYLNDRRKLSPILIGVVGSFPNIIFMSYVGLYLKDIGTLAWLIGLILALRNIYQLFLRVPLGQFSQMIGRKPLLISGVSFYVISLFLLSLSTSWVLVLVAISFLALGMSCFWPVLFAYIGDVEEDNVGKLQGRVFQGTDVGTILGSLLAVYFLKILNLGFQTLFAWGSGISLVGVVGIALFMPEVLKKENRLQVESKMKALGSSFLSMFRNLFIVSKQIKLSYIYLMQLAIAFLEYMVTAFFPFLVVAKGFPEDVVAKIFWISAGVLILFKPYFGRLIDKLGYQVPVVVTLLISSTMLVMMVIVKKLPLLIVFYIFYSASSLTSYLAVNTGTTRESKLSQRGMALGALGFYVSFSRSISTLALTPIWEKYGINYVFISTAVITTVIAVGVFLAFLIVKRKKENGNKQERVDIPYFYKEK
ncbi:MAG: MFS transporter [Candidatus Heimdallarchaeaceae archaeon]